MKLHVACGEKRLPGFTHVDGRADTHPDIVADFRSMPMIKNNSIELVYLCHGLEHVLLREAVSTLQELRRVLISGGVLRLSVPDFAALVGLYNKGVPLRIIRGAICGGQEYELNIHYSVWDEFSLAEALNAAGFTSIRRYDPFAVLPKGYFDWSIGKIAGQYISLNMEARK